MFIDLTKAFDTVNREALWDVLARYGCPPKFMQIIRAFHVDMTGQVISNFEQSDPFSNGVKQGCVLARVLFNLSFTCVLRQAVSNMEEGVYVNFRYGGSIFDLRRLSAKTRPPKASSKKLSLLMTVHSWLTSQTTCKPC